jgi:hypothetical protein
LQLMARTLGARGYHNPRTVLRPLRVALALLAPGALAAAQEPTLTIADEALGDPELYLWRARLLETVARRDTAALFALLSPTILNSFGGDGGVDEFRHKWHLTSDPDRSEVWPLLASLLSLGGHFVQPGLFVAPFYFKGSPSPPLPRGFESFDALIVVGQDVRVRSGPSTTAPIVTYLSLGVVQRDRSRSEQKDSGGTTWVPVILVSAQGPGWIAEPFLRSRIGYRLSFVRTIEGWRIRSLVAGD